VSVLFDNNAVVFFFHIHIRGRSDWCGFLYTFTHRCWPHCRGSRLTPGPVPIGDSDSKCAAD